jgi:amino acid transporter
MVPYDGPGAQPALYVTLILVFIITINYFGVGLFGEFEFWMSSAKVLVMIGLIIFTLVLAIDGGPGHHPGPGVLYWKHPGAFAPYPGTGSGAGANFLGFWNVLTSAVFSFLGAELVGVTVGEAQNPRKAIPRAVRLTFFRILFFYLLLVFLLGLTVPSDSPLLLSANNEQSVGVSGDVSPFTVAAQLAGVPIMKDFINVCLLIFTISGANSALYIATRTLYSLSVEGNAPKIFSRTNDRGVPIFALGLCSGCALIAYISQKRHVFSVFQDFVSLVTIFGLLMWISILLSHICFVRARRTQNISNTALAYVSPFGARGSMTALVFAIVILIFNGFPAFIHTSSSKFDHKAFIFSYVGAPIFVAMYLGYKLIMKTKIVTPDECDLFGGKAKIDEDEADFLAEQIRSKGVVETKYEKLYRYTLGNLF